MSEQQKTCLVEAVDLGVDEELGRVLGLRYDVEAYARPELVHPTVTTLAEVDALVAKLAAVENAAAAAGAKTLGEVACEAGCCVSDDLDAWADLSPKPREVWEAVAKAVVDVAFVRLASERDEARTRFAEVEEWSKRMLEGADEERDALFARFQAVERERDEAQRQCDEARAKLASEEERFNDLWTRVNSATADLIDEVRVVLGASYAESTAAAARRVMRERGIRARLRDAMRAARGAW